MNTKEGGVFIPNEEDFEKIKLRKDLGCTLEEAIEKLTDTFYMCNEIRDYKNKIVWKRDENEIHNSKWGL